MMKICSNLVITSIFASLLVVLSLLPNLSSAIDSNKAFQNVITFGDSLTDTGNNYWVNTEGTTGAPITSSLDTAGDERYLWVLYLINNVDFKAGKQIYPSRLINNSDLAINPATDNVNYAYASALTANDFIDDTNAVIPYFLTQPSCEEPGRADPNGPACVPGMLKQVDIYLDEVNKQINDDSLFIIWGGGNDIFNALTQLIADNAGNPPEPEVVVAQATTAAQQAVANISQMVTKLTANGASEQQIAVFDLPNLADSPAAGNNEALLNLISAGFNNDLEMQLKDLYPQVQLFSSDNILADILANPENFDIDNTQGDCVAEDNAPLCTGYLFFNAKHPTTQTHEILAKAFGQASHLLA